MMEFDHAGGQDFPLTRFESMLKTNDVLFFDSDEFELIIGHYLEVGKMALAQKAVKIALSQHPDSSALKLLKIEILLFENKIEQADSMLNALYELEASNPDVYIHKASVLSKQDRHEEAANLLKSAAEMLEDDDEIPSLIAMEYMFMEDYEQAKYYFMQCLENDEEDSAALYNIIFCFDFLEQPKQAIEFLNAFLDKHPYSEIAWHQVGLQYMQLKDYERALTSFDFAVISDDEFVGAHMEKAKVLEKLERYEEAIFSYETTLELEDPTAFAYLRIGKCYEKSNNPIYALEYYNKALQEDPLLDKTWMAITDFYFDRKQYRQALYYVEKAIAIDEENVSYWERYARINRFLKRFKETEKGLRKSMELGNYDFETWITRGDALIGLHQLEEALNVMEEACQYYPHTAEIEYRLAGLYLSLTDEKLGILHLKKALNIDCEYAVILEEIFPGIFEQKKVQALLGKKGFFK